MMSGNDELGMVYLPTTTPNSDYDGGHRKGDRLFAESIVAVNVETGQRVWHFRAVHHGVWDYDLPAAPTLLEITVDGHRIKALAQVSKQAFTYVFDRVTGRPVWPIEGRAVPPAFDFVPGINGGALWSGSGADPDTGFLYVPSKTQPVMMTLTPLPGDRQAWPSVAPIEGPPLPYVPSGKIGPPSVHPAKPAPPTGAGQDGIRNHPALAGVSLPGRSRRPPRRVRPGDRPQPLVR